MTQLPQESFAAIFVQPENSGAFPPHLLPHLQREGRKRPVVMLAFPPKAAGTNFRQAVIEAAGGALVRTGHAQGGRDAQPYLPTFLVYYAGAMPGRTLVAHAHMQALPSNIHFLEAFGIKPIIMMRSVPDMLASFLDMLETDPAARADGLNCRVPANFLDIDHSARAEFVVDIMAPWYASYYATWMAYAAAAPDNVCVLHYHDFKEEPAEALECALEHSGIVRSPEQCRAALEKAWAARAGLRFNKGERGRARSYFSPEQHARIERMLGHYPVLAPHMDELLGRGAFAAAA